MRNETERMSAVIRAQDLTQYISFLSTRPECMGTYSYIFKGAYLGQNVAIKVLKPVSYELRTMQRKFQREVIVWAHTNHPNIVPFYGYAEGNNAFGPIGSLISPWYRNGDAGRFLQERGKSLSMKGRLHLWYGVVAGVRYLHEQSPKIVHGDLKPGNVLIDDSGNPRICDFGLVHIFLEEEHTGLTTTSVHTGTDRYLAPELLSEDGERPSTASDVWALGCIGLEFLYSVVPYQHRPHNRTGLIFKDIRKGVHPASRPTNIDARTNAIWIILAGCWRLLPEERLDAQTVLLSLNLLLEQEMADLWGKGAWIRGLKIRRHEDWVRSVAFSPDGTRIISGSDDRTIRIWDTATGEELSSPFVGHEGAICSVAFSPHGVHIISGSEDWTVRMWDTGTGQSVGKPFRGHTDAVLSVAFSPEGTHIATGSADKTVRLWDAATGTPIVSPLRGHGGWVYSVVFSPDGTLIASGSEDRTVRVWDTGTGDPIGIPFNGHTDSIHSIAFSPDVTRIVSGSSDGTVRVWDPVTGRAVGSPFVGHGGVVRSVAFSPDGTCIASGSDDNTIRIWNATTGLALRAPFTGHTDVVNSVAFSSDGTRVVSGSWDKMVWVWMVVGAES